MTDRRAPPLRIAVNAYSARLGGGQTYLRNLFSHLPGRDDFEVFVFAPPDLDLPPHPRVVKVGTRWPTTNPLLRALWERIALPGWLRRERIDVLFCPGGVVGTRPPRGCHVVTMFRNMIPFDPTLVARMPWGLQRLRNRVLARVLLRSMVEADLTIFISEHARGIISARAQVPSAVTIPHGISDAFRSRGHAPSRPAGAPEGGYLLYVSRFDIYKHHAEVVRGFAALPEGVRRRYPLLLLGETNLPEAERVASLLRELRLTDQVLMPGAVRYTELPAYYRHAAAILFASSCENCPNILLESLGAGRPVLCSDVMPMPEFGGPGLIYFSPTDPPSITRALQAVLDDPSRADEVARAALERSRRYDWTATAAETWTRIFDLARGPAAQAETVTPAA